MLYPIWDMVHPFEQFHKNSLDVMEQQRVSKEWGNKDYLLQNI